MMNSSTGMIDFDKMLKRPSFIRESNSPHERRFSSQASISSFSSKYKSPVNIRMHKIIGRAAYGNDRYNRILLTFRPLFKGVNKTPKPMYNINIDNIFPKSGTLSFKNKSIHEFLDE